MIPHRAGDVGGNISSQFVKKTNDFKWSSFALKESTNVTGTAQLSFIRKINGEFGVNEESAPVNRLCGRARGENISKEVEKTLTQ